MGKTIRKQLKLIEKKEQKMLTVKPVKQGKITEAKEKVEAKIPEGLKNTLDVAFYKAFCIVFEQGSSIIEKTYNKEKIMVDHEIHDFAIRRKASGKHVRNMDKLARKTSMMQSCVSAVEGAGLGFLGIGVPDIPVFISMLLRGIYEIALSYGFDYEKEEEKYLILLMIRTALSEDAPRAEYHQEVKKICNALSDGLSIEFDKKEEIKKTAAVLSDTMLLMKFIQGLPIVGMIGGISNFSMYNRIIKYVSLEYKRRYLEGKVAGEN